MMMRRAVLATLFLGLAGATVAAQNKRDDQVKKDKNDLTGDKIWIYNDLDQAVTAAKAVKKPLLVVFR